VRRRRATFADLIFFGPFGDRGAKNCRGKNRRAPVASELASDVDVSGNNVEPERRSQAPTLQRNGGIVAVLLAVLARFA
jgi:hypothetical protein